MNKVEKKLVRKRKDNNKENVECIDKIRKVEEKNDTPKPLSSPIKFVKNTPDTSFPCNRNSQGFFDTCIRRSERLLKRSAQNLDNKPKYQLGNKPNSSKKLYESGLPSFQLAFNKYLNLNTSQNDLVGSYNQTSNYTNIFKVKEMGTNQQIKDNQSKSIFQEINHLYCNKKHDSSKNSKEYARNMKYCKLLSNQINKNFLNADKTLLNCKSQIFTEIIRVNNCLLGKSIMDSELPKMTKITYFENDGIEKNPNWQYYKKSEWVYGTPPTQKIMLPRVEHNQLQPVVLYTTKKQREIYEITSGTNNFTSLDNGGDIVFNKKVMKHLVSVRMDEDVPTSSDFLNQDKEDNEKPFDFSQPDQNKDFVNMFEGPPRPIKKKNLETFRKRVKLEDKLSQQIFMNCRLKSKETPENINETQKEKDDFNLNVLKIDQPIPSFGKHVDKPLPFEEEPINPVVNFDFKKVSKPKKSTKFEFPMNTES